MSKRHLLIVRQQPERSRVGSISEKVDRRPIDPPPIIQLVIQDPLDPNASSYTTSPAFFMQAVLMDASGQTPVRFLKGNKAAAMAGPMVCPLHTLRDESSKQGAYFVFSDLSVRLEGTFRLRFDLFEITGNTVERRATVVSGEFSVYSPKRFPGMMSSTKLSKLFAEQGLRIRIRSEEATKKRNKKAADKNSTDESNGLPLLKRARHEGNTQSLMTSKNGGLLAASKPAPTASCRNGSYPFDTVVAGISNTVFQANPFASCNNNKENVPPGGHWQGLQPKPVLTFDESVFAQNQSLNPSRSSMQCLQKTGYDIRSRAESSLSLSDIAAVALLDSLSNSNGNSAGYLQTAKDISPPLMTNAEIERILSPEVCLDQGYSRGYSASSSVPLETTIINRVNPPSQHSQQQYQIFPMMGSFDSGTNPYAATSACTSYTNYRIAPSSRTPDSIFGTRTFVDTAPRMHPILRSSSTRINGITNNGMFDLSSASSNAATASNPVSQILQLPQRQYTCTDPTTDWVSRSISSTTVMAMPKHAHASSSCTGYAGSIL
ncbi:hypothetical protein GGI15_000609 [Coemansia interrupta]|uniref:Velvet domain-containing protein n=1 Tax=Coemansia interrupta TaxID=1126814 RepID=A0A9W8HL01_9FUNG|nr:hypothetical protein GGI15_000609 [Coemansia interrupta]